MKRIVETQYCLKPYKVEKYFDLYNFYKDYDPEQSIVIKHCLDNNIVVADDGGCGGYDKFSKVLEGKRYYMNKKDFYSARVDKGHKNKSFDRMETIKKQLLEELGYEG